MRRKLIIATMSAVAVAVILLGFPLAFLGGFYVFNNEQADLENRAESLARSVENRVSRGEELDLDVLERTANMPDKPAAHVRVVMPDGQMGTAGEPIEGKILPALQYTPSNAMVTVEVSFWEVAARAYQVVMLVVAAAFVAFGAGITVAVWQANRLSAPLVYLAASAEQLGSGQVRPHMEDSGVEEIDLVAEELTRSADRLALKLAAERQFASDASHQLRTPLTALTMRLEEIQMLSDENSEVQEEARISLEQIDRLVQTVDDLLARSRKAEGGSTEAINLDDVLHQQEEEWESVFAKEGRELVVSSAQPLAVLASPGSLAQVLATLIENSLKHGAGKTTVTARHQNARGGVVIEVSDEGAGVSDDLAAKVFERGVTSGKGTGLGLPLARDLASADGGRLELSQRRPAQFTLYLAGVPKTIDAAAVLPHGNVVRFSKARKPRSK